MHPIVRSRQDERKRSFKKGIDTSKSRRHRLDESIQIRKNKRKEMALKKRNIVLENQIDFCTPSQFNIFVQMIYSNNESKIFDGVQAIRKILSVAGPQFDMVAQGNILSRLVSLLKHKNEDIQLETAWVLTNIAADTSENVKLVISTGAVPALVEMIKNCPNIENIEQSVWALGHIAGHSILCRDYVLSCGVFDLLTDLLKKINDRSFLKNGIWTLSNLIRGNPSPDIEQISGCLEPLHELLHSSEEEILREACWAISYLSDGEIEGIQAVIEAGLVPRLINLMKSNKNKIVIPSLRTVGNIVAGTEEQTQIALNMDCLNAVFHIMEKSKDKNTMKECCWLISNITAGIPSQIQKVLDSPIIFILFRWMNEGSSVVRKEIAWIITNAISGGTKDQVKYLVDAGFLRLLVDLLISQDCEIIVTCLEALNNILKVGDKISSVENSYATIIEICGGLDAIEALQNHSQEKIYKLSAEILEQYFDEDEYTYLPQDNLPEGYVTSDLGIPIHKKYLF